MRPDGTTTTAISRGLVAGFVVALGIGLGCIPSFSFTNSGGDQSGGLDRSQPCNQSVEWPGIGVDEDGTLGLNACGYPTGKDPTEDNPAGTYGFEESDVFENLVLFDCMGNEVQIAQFLPQFGLANGNVKGFVFSVGALWCMPCREEAIEWAEVFVDEFPDINFVQGLDEGPIGLDSVTPESCAGWSSANAEDKFTILYDPMPQALQQRVEPLGGSGIPYTLIMDVNANILLKKVGGKLDEGILRSQLENLTNPPESGGSDTGG